MLIKSLQGKGCVLTPGGQLCSPGFVLVNCNSIPGTPRATLQSHIGKRGGEQKKASQWLLEEELERHQEGTGDG